MTRPLLLLAIVTLMGACASHSDTLKTWEGRHTDELVLSWGPPHSKATLSDGRVVWQYTNSGSHYVPGVTTQAPTTTTVYGPRGGAYTAYGTRSVTSPGYNISHHCETKFVVGSASVIMGWSYRGNGCRGTPAPGAKK